MIRRNWNDHVKVKLLEIRLLLAVFTVIITSVTRYGIERLNIWWKENTEQKGLLASRDFTFAEVYEWLVQAIMTDNWKIEGGSAYRRAPARVILYLGPVFLLSPLSILPNLIILVIIGLFISFSIIAFWKFKLTDSQRFLQIILILISFLVYFNFWFNIHEGQERRIAEFIGLTKAIIFVTWLNSWFLIRFVRSLAIEVSKFINGYFNLWFTSGVQKGRLRTVEITTAWIIALLPNKNINGRKNGFSVRDIERLTRIADVNQERPDWVNSAVAILGIVLATQLASIIDPGFLGELIPGLMNFVRSSYFHTQIYTVLVSLLPLFILGLVGQFLALLSDYYPATVANRIIRTSCIEATILLEEKSSISAIIEQLGCKIEEITDLKKSAPDGYFTVGVCPKAQEEQTSKTWYRLIRSTSRTNVVKNPW
jgi:hypothetical protein